MTSLFSKSFLFFVLIASPGFAALNLPDREVTIQINELNTIGGNVAEIEVRRVLSQALTRSLLNGLSVSDVQDANNEIGISFKARITESRLQEVLGSIFSQNPNGGPAAHAVITY